MLDRQLIRPVRNVGESMGEKPIRDLNARREAVQKLHDACSRTVSRAMFLLLAVSLFIIVTILNSPDSALLDPTPQIRMPLVDSSLSFNEFLTIAPLVLIGIAAYVHVFLNEWHRAEAQRVELDAEDSHVEPIPTLLSMPARLPRLLADGMAYALVPVTLSIVTIKAARYPKWGLALAGVTLVCATILLKVWAARQRTRIRLIARGLIVALLLLSIGLIIVRGGIRVPFNLAHVDLTGRQLQHQDLRGADLRYAVAKEIDLSYADLRDADMRSANLAKANLRLANLDNADLSGWHPELIVQAFLGARNRLPRGANLFEANLSNAQLMGARLLAADLPNAVLRRANLQNADLDAADLSGADLYEANLSKAKFRKAILQGTNLQGATLNGTDLRGTDLSSATGLTREQVKTAVIDATTRLPDSP